MRILFPSYDQKGGIGTLARELRQHLPDYLPPEDELIFGSKGDVGRLSPLLTQLGDTKLGRFVFEQRELARQSRGVDLVHLADFRPLLASRTPFLLTIHDVTFLDHPDWFPRSVAIYKRIMLAAALRKQPEAIVCVSSWTRGRLLAHHPLAGRGRLVVVHPCLAKPRAINAQHAGGSSARRVVSDSPFFLTVSNIEPRKNHLGLLQALRLARQDGLKLRWKVVGRPSYCSRPIIQALTRDPHVDYLGWVEDEELEDLYAAARFVVTPSYEEGFGYPPLEAMARGAPVVCSSGSAFDETVGEDALRVEPGNARAWASALLELEGDQSRRGTLVKRGRKRVKEFSASRTAGAYAAIYHELRKS